MLFDGEKVTRMRGGRMIPGAVDWTDDMHTGGSFISRACIHGWLLFFFLARGREKWILGHGLWAGWCWLVNDADGP